MAGEPVNVNEFQELARQALPKMYYDFFAGGAEDQYTLKENIEAFRRITIQPRILVDVSRIDMSTIILGHKMSAPIIVAPTSSHQLAHPQGIVVYRHMHNRGSCFKLQRCSLLSNICLQKERYNRTYGT